MSSILLHLGSKLLSELKGLVVIDEMNEGLFSEFARLGKGGFNRLEPADDFSDNLLPQGRIFLVPRGVRVFLQGLSELQFER